MAVIGTGQAHGACSLLHAAGTGYGASLSLDLPVIVKALDRPSKRELKDPNNLFASVVDTWVENQLPLPDGLDLKNRFIYYVGPVDPVGSEVVGPAGPTTSSRMDKYSSLMLEDYEIIGMIGKAERGKKALASINRHNAID